VGTRTWETLIKRGWHAFSALLSISRAAYDILFGGLVILLQGEEDSFLQYEVRTQFHFLFPLAEMAKEDWYRVFPFDCASLRLNYKNICFWFRRERGELLVSLSPCHAPRDAHELPFVLAAMDSVDPSKIKRVKRLDQIADLIQPRLEVLNEKFSETGYPIFVKSLRGERHAAS
jgi:hypothetical protein